MGRATEREDWEWNDTAYVGGKVCEEQEYDELVCLCWERREGASMGGCCKGAGGKNERDIDKRIGAGGKEWKE